LLHRRFVQAKQPVAGLAAEVHVLDDVEVVAQREVLVDDLDPELGGVLRPVNVDELAVEVDLAVVVAVDSGYALDQGRLARPVVADERHDLSVAHLEVDVRERLHRAVRLRDASDLEESCLAHSGRFPTRLPVRAPARAPSPYVTPGLLAELRELADAHVALLQ